MDSYVNVREFDQDPSITSEAIVSLRTAVFIDGWKLDKQQTSHDDILDSFRLYAIMIRRIISDLS